MRNREIAELFDCSIIRLFHCSIARLFHCSMVPFFDCSVVRLIHCSIVAKFLPTSPEKREKKTRGAKRKPLTIRSWSKYNN